MPQPFTITHGPWAPDLQNVAVQMPYQYTATTVPSADVSNVYYADGAYRCLPSLAASGPAAPEALLNCFTIYDDAGQEAAVFAASEDALYTLIDGAWAAATISGGNIDISLTGSSAAFGQGGVGWTNSGGGSGGPNVNITLTGSSAAFSVGAVAAKGQLFNGTLFIATDGVDFTGFYPPESLGSLTPATDYNGNVIGAFFQDLNTEQIHLIINAAGLGQNYFATLSIPGAGVAFNAAFATYSTYTGASTWIWPSAELFWNPGTPYLMTLS